ncbi:MAG: thioredoxin family protein [Acidilobaceae archaeon]
MINEEVKSLYLEIAKRLHAIYDRLIDEYTTILEDIPRNFQDIVDTIDKPIILYFTAKWCAPCISIQETIREVARIFKGKAYFFKVDVDKDIGIAENYNVEYIPATLIIVEGEVVDRVYGVITSKNLESRILRLISS